MLARLVGAGSARVLRPLASAWTRAVPASSAAADSVGANTSTPETSRFHDAVERGDLAAVEQALNADPRLVNAGDPARSNTSALHLASRRGFVGLVQLLLERGADPDVRGAWELTPLHYAAVFDQPEVAEVLLAAGADVSLADVKGNTAADHAAKESNARVAEVLRPPHVA